MTALLLILISHSPFQLRGKLRQTGTDPSPHYWPWSSTRVLGIWMFPMEPRSSSDMCDTRRWLLP